jgi:hypothetical protein
MVGIEATKQIKSELPAIRVIGLSMHTLDPRKGSGASPELEAEDDDALLKGGKGVVFDRQPQFDRFLRAESASDMLFHHRRDRRGKSQLRSHFRAQLAVLDFMGLGFAQIVKERAAADRVPCPGSC